MTDPKSLPQKPALDSPQPIRGRSEDCQTGELPRRDAAGSDGRCNPSGNGTPDQIEGQESLQHPTAVAPIFSHEPQPAGAVPLPQVVASRAPNALAKGQWVYRDPGDLTEKLCRLADAIRYGDAREAAASAIPKELWDWLAERNLLPDIEDDGSVEWANIMQSLQVHEDGLLEPIAAGRADAVPELDSVMRAHGYPAVTEALGYSRNFAAANPALSQTTRDHIEGLCSMLEIAAQQPAAVNQQMKTQGEAEADTGHAYEWKDPASGQWLSINRPPHQWEREMGIEWRPVDPIAAAKVEAYETILADYQDAAKTSNPAKRQVARDIQREATAFAIGLTRTMTDA